MTIIFTAVMCISGLVLARFIMDGIVFYREVSSSLEKDDEDRIEEYRRFKKRIEECTTDFDELYKAARREGLVNAPTCICDSRDLFTKGCTCGYLGDK
jgi:hypothetical protein